MVETLMRLEPADVEHALGRLCVLGPLIRPTIHVLEKVTRGPPGYVLN